MITLKQGQFGWDFLIVSDDGSDLLVQTDTEYPGIARTFGWDMAKTEMCSHSETDGTVDCPTCGMTADQFIESARDFLTANEGATAEDPGYFS